MTFYVRITDGLRPTPGIRRDFGPFRAIRMSHGTVTGSPAGGGRPAPVASQDADGEWLTVSDDVRFSDVEVIASDAQPE